MRMDAFVSAIGCILFSLVAFQVTAAPQDEEENEDFIVHVLPPLKLGLPICAFKADSGPCKAINNRYHFNIQTRQCEMFNYGGCEGNANNFQTLEECQEKCIVPDFPETRKRTKFKTGIERPSYCLLESQPGICRALFSRYFYNKETQMCENFFYSGCLGNRNNFLSLKECQDTCQGSFPSGNSWQTENDSLPFGETNNSAPVAKRVTSANSLQTKEDSVLLSIKNNSSPVVKQESPLLPSLCVMPMDKGLCRASEKRFFYNYNTRKCYPFSYTGCGGNENNFTTRKACMKMCKKGFIIKQGQKGIMKIRRKRKKQPVKETNQRIVIEAI